jgi:Curli production assembly/transport component CsgG
MQHINRSYPAAARALVTVSLALSAGAAGAASGQPNVEKCPKELGTLAVAEPQDHVLASLRGYKLGSPALMLRLLAQESGCFAVVERGVAMQNLQQERALAGNGQLQADSNIGGGQMQAADFVMTPGVQFSGDTGGVGGMVGGLLNRAGGVLGALGGLAGGVKFKEAETTLLVADVRSGIQVASAEGKASKMEFSLGGWGWGGLGWAAGGGYSKTPEGKLIAASLLDNFNKVVQTIREKPTLIRSTVQASQDNAAQSTRATSTAPRAVAAAPVAPAAQPLPAGLAAALAAAATAQQRNTAPLPPGLFGAFSGQFSGGTETGTFTLVVGANGQVSGIGTSNTAGNFQVAGMVTPDGTLVMGAATQAGVPAAQFNGFINPTTGEVIGTWRMQAGGAQGMFNGKRQ